MLRRLNESSKTSSVMFRGSFDDFEAFETDDDFSKIYYRTVQARLVEVQILCRDNSEDGSQTRTYYWPRSGIEFRHAVRLANKFGFKITGPCRLKTYFDAQKDLGLPPSVQPPQDPQLPLNPQPSQNAQLLQNFHPPLFPQPSQILQFPQSLLTQEEIQRFDASPEDFRHLEENFRQLSYAYERTVAQREIIWNCLQDLFGVLNPGLTLPSVDSQNELSQMPSLEAFDLEALLAEKVKKLKEKINTINIKRNMLEMMREEKQISPSYEGFVKENTSNDFCDFSEIDYDITKFFKSNPDEKNDQKSDISFSIGDSASY